MSEFKVDSDRLKVLSSDLVGVSNSVGQVLSELSYMNLNGYTGSVNLQPHLKLVCNNVSTIRKQIYLYGDCLGNISDLYTNTEKGLCLETVKAGSVSQANPEGNPGIIGTIDKTTVKISKDRNKSYATWGDFYGNLVQDSFQTLVEKGSWPILVELFKKGILKNSKTLLTIDSVLGASGKYGLPIIGGIADAVSMYRSGESAVDSVAKAAVHVGVSWYAGSTCAGLGAVVGASLGSVVPVVGTAVGGVIGAGVGLVAGSLSSTVINGALDIVYDQVYSPYVHKAVDGVVNGVKTAGSTVVRTGKTIVDGIGRAFRTGTGWAGSVFG